MSDASIRYVGPRHIVIDDAPVPVPFWEPGLIYSEKTVVLIGGGPSHANIDLDLIKGKPFVVINSSCRKMLSIANKEDILYFTDNSWSEKHLDLIKQWKGLVVTSNRNTKARLGNVVNRLNLGILTQKMMTRSDFVQASSGHIAACLIADLGAKRIILIGFEGQAIEGRTHGHNDYQMDDINVFTERFLPGWRNLAPVFSRLGVEIINSTPQSAIPDFPYIPLEEAIR